MSIKGQSSIFYIKYNGVWVPISCEISSPISEDVEMIPTTTRDNAGWKTEKPTTQSYNIEIQAVIEVDDKSGSGMLSFNKLRQMKRNRLLIEWQRKTLSGWYIDSGKAHIVSISDSNTVNEEMTFTMTLNGFGAPETDSDKIGVLGTDEDMAVFYDDNKLIQV